MLQCIELDLKSGKVLTQTHPETKAVEPRVREIEHCGLEYWLACRGVESQWWFIDYYNGGNDTDRLLLEAEGKFLAFTNGATKGYFTDEATLQALIYGDPSAKLAPFFAADKNAAHNGIAYGSLGVSDGYQSVEVSHHPVWENTISPCSQTGVRLLVINDEDRSHGDLPLYDLQGQEIPAADLEKLYDKMGDGTLLTSSQVLQQLYTSEELNSIIGRAMSRSLNRWDESPVGAMLDAAFGGTEIDLKLVEQLEAQFRRTGSTQCDWMPEPISKQIDQAINRATDKLVSQFRAFSPDFPGQIKGMMSTSSWCRRLGVDFIISSNDVKGDDGVLTAPGVHEVERFWINRKTDATYSKQQVGPQIKGCIPESTLHELNPKIKARQAEFQKIVESPQKLATHYVTKGKERSEQVNESEIEEANELGDVLSDAGETQISKSKDWVRDVLVSDPLGWTVGLQAINSVLEGFIRRQRVDLAVNGIEIPSATAQHHSLLKPWEICNKSLPQGAVVVYYRSPFPNVGAAAIGINNLSVIREKDPEAFSKDGVSYLNPHTAKNIAITDFDGDKNAYFMGYLANDQSLPDLMRQVMEVGSLLPASEQYEMARQWLNNQIEQVELQESLIEILVIQTTLPPNIFPDSIQQWIANQIEAMENSQVPTLLHRGDYPRVVREVIDLNEPDKKPIEIIKQKKIKHAWDMKEESHTAAKWRAWEITADNPTGMVANAGMTLQSLALQTLYMPPEGRENLLNVISDHFKRLLKQIAAVETVQKLEGKLANADPRSLKQLQKQIEVTHRKQLLVPTDETLQELGFPPYDFQRRIGEIAEMFEDLVKLPINSSERSAFLETSLLKVNSLLKDVVDGPNAVNLQTAVDVAKSSRGINVQVQQLTEALAYQKHALRENQKDRKVYTKGNPLPTNTQEPIGWAVESANDSYQETHLVNRPNEAFFGLIPKNFTPEQESRALAIAGHYKGLIELAKQQKKLENSRAAKQPSIQLTTPHGNSIRIERLCDVDPNGKLPIWRAHGANPNWSVTICPREPDEVTKFSPEPLAALINYPNEQSEMTSAQLGYISELEADRHQLKQRVLTKGEILIKNPSLIVHPPLKLQSTSDQLRARANQYLIEAVTAIPQEERIAYASILWHRSDTMEMVLKAFTPEICSYLESPQKMRVMGISRDSNEAGRSLNGRYLVRTFQREYERNGETRVTDGIAVKIDGTFRYFGAFDSKSLRLPPETEAIATIQTPLSPTLEATLIDDRQFKIEALEEGYLGHQSLDNVAAQLEIQPTQEKFQVSLVAREGQSYPIGTMTFKSLSDVIGEVEIRKLRTTQVPISVEVTLNRDYANYAFTTVDPQQQERIVDKQATDRAEEITLATTANGNQLVIVDQEQYDSSTHYCFENGVLQFSRVGNQGFAWVGEDSNAACIGRLDDRSMLLIEDIGKTHGRNFFEEECSIPVILHTTLATLAQKQDSARYCPSIHDLRLWNMAIEQAAMPDQTIKEAWVRSIASQLLNGTPQNNLSKSDRDSSFRNPVFTLTVDEYDLMNSDIQLLGSQLDSKNSNQTQLVEAGLEK
jgi:hypothetical protein